MRVVVLAALLTIGCGTITVGGDVRRRPTLPELFHDGYIDLRNPVVVYVAGMYENPERVDAIRTGLDMWTQALRGVGIEPKFSTGACCNQWLQCVNVYVYPDLPPIAERLTPNVIVFDQWSSLNPTIFAHEFGHALGLGHALEMPSIMYQDPWGLRSVTADDARAVCRLQGLTCR